MNYIYDVLLNFKKQLYDFYEWDIADEIIHIRRIPVIRISSKALFDIKSKKIKLEDNMLKKYHNKTEIFQKKSIKTIGTCAIFTDTKESVACLFKNNQIDQKSRLLIDEDEDLLEIGKSIIEEDLKYFVTKAYFSNPFKTKYELEMERYVDKKLNKIKDCKVLEYLYYECFNRKPEKNINVKNIIKKKIKEKEELCKKAFEFLKLTAIKK